MAKEVSVAKKPRRNKPKADDRRRGLHPGQQPLERRCFVVMPVGNKYQLGSASTLNFGLAELPNEHSIFLEPFFMSFFPFSS